DTIRMEVYAKYVDPNRTNWTSALSTLASYLVSGATAPTGTILDGAEYATSNFTPPWAIGNLAHDGGLLNAGLTYIMFDRDMHTVFDPTQTNIVQISRGPREYGQ